MHKSKKEKRKGSEDDAAENQTEQEENLDAENNGLTEKLSQENDELSEAGAV